MIAEELRVLVRAETQQAVRNLQQVQRQTGSTDNRMQGLTRTIGAKAAAMASLAAVVALVANEMRASLRDYAALETAQNKVQSAARLAGENIALVIPQYNELAAEIQSLTVVSDGATLEMIALAQQMGVTSEDMGDVIRGATGISRAFGMGTQQSIRAVTQALAGNADMLGRYSPAIRNATTDAERLAAVNQLMEDSFEMARGETDTLAGAMSQLRNEIGNAREVTGEMLSGPARRIIQWATTFAEQATAAATAVQTMLSIFDRTEEVVEPSVAAIERWRAGISETRGSLESLERQTRDYNEAIEDARVAAIAYGMSLDELVATHSGWAETVDNANAGLARYEPRIAAANAEIARLQNLIQRVQNPTRRTTDDFDAMTEALARFAEVNRDMAGIQDDRFLSNLSEEARAVEELERRLTELVEIRAEFRGLGVDTTDSGLQREINFIVAELERARSALDGTEKDMKKVAHESEKLAGMRASAQMAEEMEAIAEAAQRTRDRFTEMTESVSDRVLRMASDFASAGVAMEDVARWAAMEMAQHYLGAAQMIHGAFSGLFSEIQNLSSQSARHQIADLRAVMDEAQQRREQEIMWAEASGATEADIAEIKMQQAREQEQLEEEIAEKEAQLRQRQFRMDQVARIGQATMAGAQAVIQALTVDPTGILSTIVGSMAAAQIGVIAAQKPPAFERGGSFVTSGPQMIMVGDGQSPRERVTVEPLSGPYRGSAGGGGITVNINGAVGGREEVAEWVWEGIRRGQQRGAIRA